MLKNKTLLITGGTGSFGNAVVNHFLNSNLKKIIIFSPSAASFDQFKNFEERGKFFNKNIKYIIKEVRK